MEAATVETEDLSLYKPPQKKIAITARVPVEVREGLDDLVRLWRELARARGDNEAAIDLTFVISRLLENGIETGFDEFGGRPTDEEGWKTLIAAVNKSVKKSSR